MWLVYNMSSMERLPIGNYIIGFLLFVLPVIFIVMRLRLVQKLWAKCIAMSAKERVVVVAKIIAGLALFVLAVRIFAIIFYTLLIMSGVPCGESGGVYCDNNNFFEVVNGVVTNKYP